MSMTPKTPKRSTTRSRNMRDSTSDEEVEIVSPQSRGPMAAIAEINEKIDAVVQEGKNIKDQYSNPFKKSTTTTRSPSTKTTTEAFEVTKKPSENIKTYLRTPMCEETAKASTSTAESARESTKTQCISPLKAQYKDTKAEAKAYHDYFKAQMGNSKNLKTEIKNQMTIAIDRMYKVTQKLEKALTELRNSKESEKTSTQKIDTRAEAQFDTELESSKIINGKDELLRKLEEHASLTRENNKKISDLQGIIDKHSEILKETRASYAGVVSGREGANAPVRPTLHSIIITDKNQAKSGDEVFESVRKTLNTKEENFDIVRARRGKDKKIIIGCRTTSDRERVMAKLKENGHLNAEEIKNKNPLIQVIGVLKVHTDEVLIKALRNQNRRIFDGLDEDEKEMVIAYKVRGRNPLTQRVILRVAPRLWQRMTEAGTIRVDLQTLHVIDRSPLVQCSQCLGYGHGRRYCTEPEPKCAHCGDLHKKFECPSYREGAPPTCCNCVKEKRSHVKHNAFDSKCPIRSRWDEVARASIAYC